MDREFYGEGQHNGGVYNSGNLNPYIYTYQNPIKYIDPNGKQIEWSLAWEFSTTTTAGGTLGGGMMGGGLQLFQLRE
ncbi:hypothetical protein [Chryseobacterium indologenes]|nr:hypothetical protein [Chryseobacterium indologenes]